MARKTSLGLVAAIAALMVLVSSALADVVISPSGSGPGQSSDPGGLALNDELGSLYVADTGNNRVNIFDTNGTFLSSFGSKGAGGGQFNAPGSIAVDNDPISSSHGDVYVFDATNRRVQKFDPTGKFLLTFGRGVNLTNGGDICVAGSGDICGAGSGGGGERQFQGNAQIGVAPNGVVYVADGETLGSGLKKIRLQKFDSSGALLSQMVISEGQPSFSKFATARNGDFYIASQGDGTIRKYDSAGNQLKAVSEGDVAAISVDALDHLFVANRYVTGGFVPSANIVEYDASVNPIRRFGYGSVLLATNAVAGHHSSNGDVYVADSGGVRQLPYPPPGPVIEPSPCAVGPIGSVFATVTCRVNPEGKPTTIHFDYIDQAGFEAGGFTGAKQSTESASIGDDFYLHAAANKMIELEPETTYHYRVVASNADGSGIIGPAGTFETGPPLALGARWVSAVGAETAQLNGEVNPFGSPTTGFFEYVDDTSFEASEFATAGKSAVIDFGSGEGLKVGSAVIVGLTPGVLYHYRLVVQNAFKTLTSQSQTFRAFNPVVLTLPDGRAFEQVSPPQKESGEVGSSNAAAGLFDLNYMRILQSSPNGEAISYTSFTAFGSAEGAPGTSQYISRRGAGGWSTNNITPPTFGANPLRPPYRGFNANLTLGGIAVKEPTLVAGAPSGVQNLYFRDTTTGGYQLLSAPAPTLALAPEEEYCVAYAGASADGSRVIFAANGALATTSGPSAPVGAGFSLYEWSSEAGVRLVSVLANETAAPLQSSGPRTAFGERVAGSPAEFCGVGKKMLSHVISEDGRRIFWTYIPKTGESQLLARVDRNESVQLDLKQGGPSLSGGGRFVGASADGTKAFFIGQNRLVSGATAGDLYRYDFDAALGSRLTDISKDPTPGTDPPSVRGVLGFSDDGSHAYFVASGVLTPGEKNAQGQEAQPGQANLYLWRQDEPLKFVALLDSDDGTDWSVAPAEQTARAAPDGRHLAFLSRGDLTGYDNTVQGGSGCEPDGEGGLTGSDECAEAYIYEADSGELTCASCNPSGGRPVGPALLPAWGSPFQERRYLSDDGRRFFFESLDPLLPADTNGMRDVYEFERAGVGTCTTQSSTFDPSTGGCLFLISTGTSADDSLFLDASTDGSNAFFATRQRLVGWDLDERYDVYDARVGGGFPEPVPPVPPCAGEACRPPSPAPPPASSPGTSGFSGPGNPVAKPKKHKKHKKSKHKKHRKKGKQKQGKHKNGKSKKRQDTQGVGR